MIELTLDIHLSGVVQGAEETMARRSREQVLAEFHRLYDCFDAALEASRPIPDFFDVSRSELATRDTMLAWRDCGKTTTTELVSGVWAGLADLRLGLRDLQRNRPAEAKGFESRYLALRSKSFLADVTAARKESAS